jgi:hypothetical protein
LPGAPRGFGECCVHNLDQAFAIQHSSKIARV